MTLDGVSNDFVMAKVGSTSYCANLVRVWDFFVSIEPTIRLGFFAGGCNSKDFK